MRTPPPRIVTLAGRCRRNPDLFDVDRLPGEDQRQQRERITAAEFVCAGCPVLDECQRWAQAQPRNTFHGVVGGERYRTNWYPTNTTRPQHKTGRTPSEGAAR